MPRDSSGDYALPSGNPVAPGEIIKSVWANTTMDDIAIALSDSLDRYGRGGMLAPFKFADGSRQAPGATWTNEPNTGLYRAAAGDLRMSVRANDVMRWENLQASIWDPVELVWRKILTQGGQGGVPEGDEDGQIIRWDENSSRWQKTSLLKVSEGGTVTGLFRGVAVNQLSTRIEVVNTLPTGADPNTLYLVRE